MDYTAAPLEKLIEEFGKFQGVGRKGATRMAYQVLSMSDKDAAALADAIRGAHTRLHRCRICQNFTDAELCPVCASAKRDTSVICVVEKPRDVQAFERTREYNGLYHVLHGLLDPLAGVGAEQLTVKELLARLKDDTVKEVIMAMNPTVEGEATAMYLAKLSRWASGSPGLPPVCRWAQAWNTPTRPPCTGRFPAGESCKLVKIYNSVRNSPCITLKKWYTETTNRTEKGGAQHGTHKGAPGDQDHRHQPRSAPRVFCSGSAGDRCGTQRHRGEKPAGRRGQPEG